MLAGKLTVEDEEDLEQELLALQEEQVITPYPSRSRAGHIIEHY